MAQWVRDREDEARRGYRSAVMDEVERCGHTGVSELARERHTKSNCDEGRRAVFTYSFWVRRRKYRKPICLFGPNVKSIYTCRAA